MDLDVLLVQMVAKIQHEEHSAIARNTKLCGTNGGEQIQHNTNVTTMQKMSALPRASLPRQRSFRGAVLFADRGNSFTCLVIAIAS